MSGVQVPKRDVVLALRNGRRRPTTLSSYPDDRMDSAHSWGDANRGKSYTTFEFLLRSRQRPPRTIGQNAFAANGKPRRGAQRARAHAACRCLLSQWIRAPKICIPCNWAP